MKFRNKQYISIYIYKFNGRRNIILLSFMDVEISIIMSYVICMRYECKMVIQVVIVLMVEEDRGRPRKDQARETEERGPEEGLGGGKKRRQTVDT